MFRAIRYLMAILLLVYGIYIFKSKETKFKIIKGIGYITGFLIILTMPFEMLFLTFDTPEQAFNYGGNNYTIIDIVENEKSALIIYKDDEIKKATIINKHNGKWKGSFFPNDQDLLSLGINETVLITRERSSDNFYIIIAVDPDIKSVADNQNSNFKIFSTELRTHYVAYVENYKGDYIITIDDKQYEIEI